MAAECRCAAWLRPSDGPPRTFPEPILPFPEFLQQGDFSVWPPYILHTPDNPTNDPKQTIPRLVRCHRLAFLPPLMYRGEYNSLPHLNPHVPLVPKIFC